MFTAPAHPSPAGPPTSSPQGPDTALSGLSAPVLNSAALLQGQKSVCIVHNGQAYRLQATKLGKLILTK